MTALPTLMNSMSLHFSLGYKDEGFATKFVHSFTNFKYICKNARKANFFVLKSQTKKRKYVFLAPRYLYSYLLIYIFLKLKTGYEQKKEIKLFSRLCSTSSTTNLLNDNRNVFLLTAGHHFQ